MLGDPLGYDKPDAHWMLRSARRNFATTFWKDRRSPGVEGENTMAPVSNKTHR
jgi:hypothetical protein